MNRREFVVMCAAVPLAAVLPVQPEPVAWKFDRLVGSWYYEVPSGETITGLREVFGELYVFTATSVYRVPRLPGFIEKQSKEIKEING